MKVLFVMGNGRSDDTLGDHALPINLANALVRQGVDVTVLANSKDNGTIDSRIDIIPFEFPNSHNWAKKLISQSDKVYHECNFDHVSYHFSALSVVKWVANLPDDMHISYVHHSAVMGGISTVNIKDDIIKLNTKPNTKIVMISDFMNNSWKNITDVPKEDIIPNAIRIDNGVTYPDIDSIISSDRRNGKLIHVGRIDQVKNTRQIVDLIRQYEIPSIIIGQPQKRKTGNQTYADECVELIKDTPCIDYIPWMKNNEVRQLVAESTASINISNLEGMCLALLESLSVGTPILSSTTCVANREVLTLDESEPIGPVGDYVDTYRKRYNKRLELLYDAWVDLKSNPRDPYNIYNKSKKYYDIDKVAKDYIDMFESLM